jgi:hypothetical protein
MLPPSFGFQSEGKRQELQIAADWRHQLDR